MKKIKIVRATTIPLSLNVLLKGQLRFLSQYFEIMTLSSPGVEVEELVNREGVKHTAIPIERDINISKDIVSLKNIINFFKKYRPHIVHTNTPKSSLLTMIASYLVRVPIRIYNVTGLRFQGYDSGIKRMILIMMEKLSCFFSTHVIAEGVGVKDTLITHNITKKPIKILANGNINGIDTLHFSPSSISLETHKSLKIQLDISEDDFVFIFIGRIVTDKGINELLVAFDNISNNLDNVKLILVGPLEDDQNPINDNSRKILKENKSIISVGFQSDVRPFLSISNVFVFPSYREGFPNVVMQAGAMGLPSIVTNINGSNEIIIDGQNGIIIPSKDVDALQKNMISIMRNGTDYKIMKTNARNMITSRYEQSIVWQAILEEYKLLLAEKGIKFA